MISQLDIRNFQAHRRLSLDLGQISSIVGPSDSGKSAILRALRWLALNVPRGSTFIRDGSEWSRVRVVVDGKKLSRTKAKGKNCYSINGDLYEALGTDVPKEVQEILRLGPDCFQDQHDSPFWFALSPPEVSRRLNDVVDLTVIDTTLGNLATQLRKASTELGVIEQRVQEADEARKNLVYAVYADKDLAALEKLDAKAARTRTSASALQGLTEQASELTRAVQDRRKASQDGKALLVHVKIVTDVAEDVESVESLIGKARDLQRMVTAKDDIASLGHWVGKFEERHQKIVDLDTMIADAKKMAQTIKHFREEHRKASKKLAMEMGDRCLLCGGALKNGQ